MEVHEDWLTGKEKFTNPVYSSSCSLLTAPPLLPPRWGANLLSFAEIVLYAPHLPRRSSPGVGAFRETSRNEKNGVSRSLIHFMSLKAKYTGIFDPGMSKNK